MHNENVLSRLSKRSMATLGLLLKSPTALQAVHAAESADVARRSALAARLAALPEQHAKEIGPAIKRADQCLVALNKAQAQAAAALQAYNEARQGCTTFGLVFERDVAALTTELEKSADPRLAAFAWEAENLHERVRHDVGPNTLAAMEACRWGQRQALSLRLVPLTSADVATELTSIASQIRGRLAAVGATPPAIEIDDNIVIH